MSAHFVGTAGWNIPKIANDRFPSEGSHLHRYSQKLSAVEINSSFYKPHQAKTYKRWAEENLSFAVKMTKEFTHEKRLDVEDVDLELWLAPVQELGEKFGVLLVQIPPKLEFDRAIANAFFKNVREITQTMIALEPRHISWTTRDARELLDFYDVTKVEADPERCPTAPDKSKPRYIRLHGSPAIYKSNYEPKVLKKWADDLSDSAPSWVIFDNTTFGFGTLNALDLKDQLENQTVVAASSSSRKLSRRKRGATKNIAATVKRDTVAPKTAD